MSASSPLQFTQTAGSPPSRTTAEQAGSEPPPSLSATYLPDPLNPAGSAAVRAYQALMHELRKNGAWTPRASGRAGWIAGGMWAQSRQAANLFHSSIKALLVASLSLGWAVPTKAAPARPPQAFAEFCDRNPADCEAVGPLAWMEMSRKRWAELTSVHRAVNRSIRYRTDMAQWRRADVWSVVVGRGAGDCEDFVLTKRRRLLELGWPSSALLVTLVRIPNGQGHAVLTVRTNEGDFVLDNLSRYVRPVRGSGYRFFSMQSPSDPRVWIRIPRSGPVSSPVAAKKARAA